MRQAVLLGSPGMKRSVYLEQAADREGLPVLFADRPGSETGLRLTGRKGQKSGAGLRLIDWKDWESGRAHLPEGELFVKIDPPVWESCRLEELGTLTEHYRSALKRLAEMEKERRITFLNHPTAILELLDKRACKRRLREAGLPVTEELALPGGEEPASGELRAEEVCEPLSGRGETVSGGLRAEEVCEPLSGGEEPASGKARVKELHEGEVCVSSPDRKEPASGKARVEVLLDCMRAQRVYQVFIKPVYGSGAAGVSAFRFQPSTGRMMLYTCAQLHPVYGLVNTKRLRCFSGREDILPLLEEILGLSCIVERWYAKAEHGRYSYDLRMVMQEGEPDFLLARLSKGPVTNLHLNNHPMEFAELGLPARVKEEAAELCQRAMECFPGLSCAGIDLLPERGSLSLRVIEMNAQGDLIYQDIFHENRIYRHQAAMMKRWMEEENDVCEHE